MITYNNDDLETIRLYNPSQRKIDFILSAVAEQILHQIRLFRPEKARDLGNIVLPLFHEIYSYLFYASDALPERKDFEEIKRLKYTVRSLNDTKEWLTTLGIPSQTEMILSYDFQTALAMPWAVFIEAYEKFCYNGLDDICIFSPCEQWYLLYYHEDIFLFGKRHMNNDEVLSNSAKT